MWSVWSEFGGSVCCYQRAPGTTRFENANPIRAAYNWNGCESRCATRAEAHTGAQPDPPSGAPSRRETQTAISPPTHFDLSTSCKTHAACDQSPHLERELKHRVLETSGYSTKRGGTWTHTWRSVAAWWCGMAAAVPEATAGWQWTVEERQ